MAQPRFIILDTPLPLSGSGLVVAQHTTLNSHFEPWNGFMFSLGYMKNLPSCRENLSITIQRMSALTPHFFFRVSANKLSYMNSQKQIVIQDSGVIMCQLCIYVVSQIATQQKKIELYKIYHNLHWYHSRTFRRKKRQRNAERAKRRDGAFQRGPAGPQGSTKWAFAIVSIC